MAKVIRQRTPAKLPTAAGPRQVIRDFSLQRYLADNLREQMRADGYNEKRRTRWIEEAIAGLMLFDASMMDSATGDRATTTDPAHAKLVRTKTRIRADLERNVSELVRTLKFQDPDIVGHYSYVIRCAIRYRMRNPDRFPPSDGADGDDLIARAVKLNFESPF